MPVQRARMAQADSQRNVQPALSTLDQRFIEKSTNVRSCSSAPQTTLAH